MTTVLLLDDHPLIVSGLAHFLSTINQVEVAGQAHSPQEALTFLKKYPVDILVCDMHFDAGMSGIHLLLQVKEHYPTMKVIFYTMVEKTNEVREAVLAGADGYVLKRYNADDVLAAINLVHSNRRYFSPELVQILATTPESTKHTDQEYEPLRTITSREREVMMRIARDWSNSQIADDLSVSESTVNTHRANLMTKLGVRSNVGIAHFAFKYGMLD
ncbi:response regulator [Fibrella arboris]|uniref:response regulator n=1 Tax=Fibrella arboris TaxID=3242486 RepID=UPI003521C95B